MTVTAQFHTGVKSYRPNSCGLMRAQGHRGLLTNPEWTDHTPPTLQTTNSVVTVPSLPTKTHMNICTCAHTDAHECCRQLSEVSGKAVPPADQLEDSVGDVTVPKVVFVSGMRFLSLFTL